MKRQWRCFTVVFLLVVLGGCSRFGVLPPLPTAEEQRVLADWQRYLAQREECDAVDVDVSARWDSLLQGARVNGFLQLLAPQSLKFVVTDPLGRPLAVLTMVGERVLLLEVERAIAYEGTRQSKTMQQLVFGRIPPEVLLAILLQRVPRHFLFRAVSRGEEEGYWLQFVEQAGPFGLAVLFLPESHQVSAVRITDGTGKLLTVRYTGGPLACGLPRKLEINGGMLAGKGTLSYEQVYPGAVLRDDDFVVAIPAGYRREALP